MTANSASAERRVHERRTLHGTALLLLPGNKTMEVRTADISVGGIGIIAEANPRLGSSFTIRVTLPRKPRGNCSFKVGVRVMHSVFASTEGGFKIGLQFLQLDALGAAAIDEYLHDRG